MYCNRRPLLLSLWFLNHKYVQCHITIMKNVLSTSLNKHVVRCQPVVGYLGPARPASPRRPPRSPPAPGRCWEPSPAPAHCAQTTSLQHTKHAQQNTTKLKNLDTDHHLNQSMYQDCMLIYMHVKTVGVYNYFCNYIHLRFKHAVLGTQFSCLGCLSRTVSRFL